MPSHYSLPILLLSIIKKKFQVAKMPATAPLEEIVVNPDLDGSSYCMSECERSEAMQASHPFSTDVSREVKANRKGSEKRDPHFVGYDLTGPNTQHR